MSLLSAIIGAAVDSAVGELISQGTDTVTVEQKSYMRYQCVQCKRYSIHEHVIKMVGKAEKRLWNSAQETENKAAERARKDIRRIDEITFHEVNQAHNYGHINEEVFCPFCNARQPWSRGRGKKELDLLESPGFVHPVYYNASNIDELRRIIKEDTQEGLQPSANTVPASGKPAQASLSPTSPVAGESILRRAGDLSQGAASQKEAQATPYVASALGKTRYNIEHRMLWQHFFTDHERTIALLASRNGLYTLYKKTFETAGITCPYKPEEFQVSHAEEGNSLRIVSLELPEPEHVPLCYRIYLLYDPTHKNAAYYTIERGKQGGFLCGWDQNGTHINYSTADTPKWPVGERSFHHAMETIIVTDLYKKAFSIGE